MKKLPGTCKFFFLFLLPLGFWTTTSSAHLSLA